MFSYSSNSLGCPIVKEWFNRWKELVGYDTIPNPSIKLPKLTNYQATDKDVAAGKMPNNIITIISPDVSKYLKNIYGGEELKQYPIRKDHGIFYLTTKNKEFLCKTLIDSPYITRIFSHQDQFFFVRKDLIKFFKLNSNKNPKLYYKRNGKYHEVRLNSLVGKEKEIEKLLLWEGNESPNKLKVKKITEKPAEPKDNLGQLSNRDKLELLKKKFLEDDTPKLDSQSKSSQICCSPNQLTPIIRPSSSITNSSYNYGGYYSGLGPGKCGLSNLGNTCYFNSGIQCLMHSMPLVKYIVEDHWEHEVNYRNPLGMHGKLITAFAELTRKLWRGDERVLTPSDLKHVTGEFAQQFAGYGQQDPHELILFMLDGIHEDLNRRLEKPMVETVTGDGTNDEETAEEAWKNHKLRNDSVIVDNFHGQLRSICKCPRCGKTTVVFDPFVALSLPLSPPSVKPADVLYIPYDMNKKHKWIHIEVPRYSEAKDYKRSLKSHIAADFVVGFVAASTSLYSGITTRVVFEPNDASFGRQLRPVAFEVPDRGRRYVLASLRAFVGGEFSYSPTTEAVMREVFLVDVTDADDEEGMQEAIYQRIAGAWEEPQVIREVRDEEEEGKPSSLFRSSVPPMKRFSPSTSQSYSQKDEDILNDLDEEDKDQEEESEAIIDIPDDISEDDSQNSEKDDQNSDNGEKSDDNKSSGDDQNNSGEYDYYEEEEEEDSQEGQEEESDNRGKSDDDDIDDDDPFSKNSVLSIQNKTIPKTSLFAEHTNTEAPIRTMGTTPITFTSSPQAGFAVTNNSSSSKVERHFDGILEDPDLSPRTRSVLQRLSHARPKDFLEGQRIRIKKPYMFSTWRFVSSQRQPMFHADTIAVVLNGEEMCDEEGFVPSRLLSSFDVDSRTPKQTEGGEDVTLEQCLRFFTQEEILDEANQWFCPSCREFVCARKKMDLWKLPRCLVIQLKRFETTETGSNKDEKLVEFPDELDLTDFVAGPTECPRYRLYAVSQHYGGLSFGHCTAEASVCNGEEREWYSFNDSSCSRSSSASPHTTAAYVLFYERLDGFEVDVPEVGGGPQSFFGPSREIRFGRSPSGAPIFGEAPPIRRALTPDTDTEPPRTDDERESDVMPGADEFADENPPDPQSSL